MYRRVWVSLVCVFLIVVLKGVDGGLVGKPDKKDVTPDRFNEDYPDYQLGVRYDEYPMIVPKKRTALLVNRLMEALRDALDDEESNKIMENNVYDGYGSNRKFISSDDIRTMDLQRRGPQPNGRIYWRCYFNAVSCF